MRRPTRTRRLSVAALTGKNGIGAKTSHFASNHMNAQAPPVHAGGRAQRRPGSLSAFKTRYRDPGWRGDHGIARSKSPWRRLYPGVDRKPAAPKETHLHAHLPSRVNTNAPQG